MAGHSKWANIKHKKAKEDAARGKAFTKLIKEITVVARDGGGDPASNPRLRTLMEKARSINMPQDNVSRAVRKGTGELTGVHYETFLYEGYGPADVGVLVEVLTDNKNRAAADVRRLFTKNNGQMADTGSVSWMFEQQGVIKATSTHHSEDDLLEMMLEHNVSDIKSGDGVFFVTCTMKDLETVKSALVQSGVTVEQADVEWVPNNPMTLSDEHMEAVASFIDALEENDDVQNIYANVA